MKIGRCVWLCGKIGLCGDRFSFNGQVKFQTLRCTCIGEYEVFFGKARSTLSMFLHGCGT